jgi:hypothetical protein
MQDAKLFTEVVLAVEEGIKTYSKKSLDDIYERHEAGFPDEAQVRTAVNAAMGWLAEVETIHGGALTKPYNLYSLLLARMHQQTGLAMLDQLYEFGHGEANPGVTMHLSELQEALEAETPKPRLRPFVAACKDATNTLKNRQMRFRWFCAALDGKQL